MSDERIDTDQTKGEEIAERARGLEQTFGLSPETAQVTAENKATTGMRKPASDDVDDARAAEARATTTSRSRSCG